MFYSAGHTPWANSLHTSTLVFRWGEVADFYFARPESKNQFDAWLFQRNESPNLASGSIVNTQTFADRLDSGVRKYLRTVFVEEWGLIVLELQCGRKFEREEVQEDAEEKDGFP